MWTEEHTSEWMHPQIVGKSSAERGYRTGCRGFWEQH